MALKIYKHTGNGHYIGSAMIVVAESMEEALTMIRKMLDENGLINEALNVTEHKVRKGVVYENNGDY